jgi:hypothetical protein
VDFTRNPGAKMGVKGMAQIKSAGNNTGNRFFDGKLIQCEYAERAVTLPEIPLQSPHSYGISSRFFTIKWSYQGNPHVCSPPRAIVATS